MLLRNQLRFWFYMIIDFDDWLIDDYIGCEPDELSVTVDNSVSNPPSRVWEK